MADDKDNLRGALHFASVGMMLVISILVGFAIGLYLDGVFSTEPWLMIIFTILGVISGFKSLYDMVKKYGFDDKDKSK